MQFLMYIWLYTNSVGPADGIAYDGAWKRAKPPAGKGFALDDEEELAVAMKRLAMYLEDHSVIALLTFATIIGVGLAFTFWLGFLFLSPVPAFILIPLVSFVSALLMCKMDEAHTS